MPLINLVKVLSNIDTGLFQKVKCRFFGKIQNLRALNIYGISFNPPVNSFGVSFRANNHGDNLFVAVDDPENRFTGLKPGELKIGNYETGAYVHFKEDGSIDIEAASSKNVTIKGNLVVQGDIVTNNISTPSVFSYNAHTHSGVQTGASNTGGPT